MKLLKANHLSQRYSLEDQINHTFPKEIQALRQKAEGYTCNIQRVQVRSRPDEESFCSVEIEGPVHTEKKAAGSEILETCQAMKFPDPVHLGKHRGFDLTMHFETVTREYKITLIGSLRYTVPLGTDIFGNVQHLDNTLDNMPARLKATNEYLESTRLQLEEAKAAVNKPLPLEDQTRPPRRTQRPAEYGQAGKRASRRRP